MILPTGPSLEQQNYDRGIRRWPSGLPEVLLGCLSNPDTWTRPSGGTSQQLPQIHLEDREARRRTSSSRSASGTAPSNSDGLGHVMTDSGTAVGVSTSVVN